jgi:hypothetical protein
MIIENIVLVNELTQEDVKELIKVSPAFAVNCLKELYKLQTAEERTAEKTSLYNGVGFTGYDAQLLTSFAKQVYRWESESQHMFLSPLSPKQMTILRDRLQKYSKQLVDILNG